MTDGIAKVVQFLPVILNDVGCYLIDNRLELWNLRINHECHQSYHRRNCLANNTGCLNCDGSGTLSIKHEANGIRPKVTGD